MTILCGSLTVPSVCLWECLAWGCVPVVTWLRGICQRSRVKWWVGPHNYVNVLTKLSICVHLRGLVVLLVSYA